MTPRTHPVELTFAETQALGHIFAAMAVSGLNARLADKFGEAHSVALDSVMLKVARAETTLGDEPPAPDEADAIATFAANLDQRRAALEEHGE